ncbi:MAG: glucose-1-phosphate cytidylyltransferase [candidate division NC10 bacterium]|nr:glucose-1-phosphate cytidylyltransferase [candidate division NC10 bacterium]
MKVVLFCGGLGMRLREFSEAIPKPMVPLGYRPILWHVMRYYAHFGHKDFILCLGHKADVIKSYFRNYDETISNDFILAEGGQRVELLAKDIQDWRITFVDTGVNASIGQRLMAVRPFLEGEPTFLANYGDGLSDLRLPDMIDYFEARDAVACFVGVQPTSSFHLVDCAADGRVKSIRHIKDIGLRVNGGFFVLRQEIFDYMEEGEELVEQPFERLAAAGKLLAYPFNGFWACMDTFKERQLLEDMYTRGHPPWEVWARNSGPRAPEK